MDRPSWQDRCGIHLKLWSTEFLLRRLQGFLRSALPPGAPAAGVRGGKRQGVRAAPGPPERLETCSEIAKVHVIIIMLLSYYAMIIADILYD